MIAKKYLLFMFPLLAMLSCSNVKYHENALSIGKVKVLKAIKISRNGSDFQIEQQEINLLGIAGRYKVCYLETNGSEEIEKLELAMEYIDGNRKETYRKVLFDYKRNRLIDIRSVMRGNELNEIVILGNEEKRESSNELAKWYEMSLDEIKDKMPKDVDGVIIVIIK
jgi:hypothetical protein